MPIHFINVQGREHDKLFGPGAFYDLYLTGDQHRQWLTIAERAVEGETCIVASYAPRREDVIFRTYSLSRWSIEWEQD